MFDVTSLAIDVQFGDRFDLSRPHGLETRVNPGSGAGEKSRTPDLRITNALLYQLSYAGVALTIEDGRGEPRILAERDRPHFIANSASFLGTGAFFRVA